MSQWYEHKVISMSQQADEIGDEVNGAELVCDNADGQYLRVPQGTGRGGYELADRFPLVDNG
jgi:hypothetical protein